ncbi:hypothetical protein JL721_7363 [Aureococcus anophagefferens]|nr:hypothetical protein JL721_7363 [Aureococcus anophagefferens]
MAPNYVRVGVRIRQAVVRLELGEKRAREFAYDYAFGPEASQADVFDAVAAPVVDAVAAGGAHGTVFAYGQTGTGKSHTMGILEARRARLTAAARADLTRRAPAAGRRARPRPPRRRSGADGAATR